MTHDTGMLRAKIRKAMERIGKTNGHACPDTTSNTDPAMHEMFVAAEGQAYWKSRFDEAKEAVIAMSSGIDQAVEGVIDLNAGTSLTALDGELYSLQVDISKPASRLDQRALRSYLQVHCGLTKEQVDEAFTASSKLNAPAKKFKVASK